jgi:hypothetical protein
VVASGIRIIFSNSVPTSQRTGRNFITTPSNLILFRKTVAVYSENKKEYVNALCEDSGETRVLNLVVQIVIINAALNLHER